MNAQPFTQLQATRYDHLLDGAGWLILLIIWIVSITAMTTLPREIPNHFNLQGEPDGYGSPNFIITVPIVTSLLLMGLTWLNHYPHKFNYPTKITPENALRQYTNATRLIRVLKISIAVVSLMIAIMMFQSADNKSARFAIWLLPAIVLAVYTPLAIYLYRSFKIK